MSRPYSVILLRPRKKRASRHLAAAVVVGVADALALADLHAGFGVVRRRGAHALLDLAGHGQEGLLDVAGVLGRGLEEGDAQAVGELLQRGLVTNDTYSRRISQPRDWRAACWRQGHLGAQAQKCM